LNVKIFPGENPKPPTFQGGGKVKGKEEGKGRGWRGEGWGGMHFPKQKFTTTSLYN